MSLNLQGLFFDIPISTVYPRWTVDEIKDMIAFLKQADFDPTVIDTDLHKRVADAIQDWIIRRFDMRVNSRDGDQGLSMWMRDVEEVVREFIREIMRDERFKSHQNFTFKASLQDDSERVYGGEANTAVSFQIGQIRCCPSQVIPGYPRLS